MNGRGIPTNAIIGLLLIGTLFLAAVIALFWTPFDPLRLQLSHRLQAPSLTHLLGTDEMGRDILSRLMAGASTSVMIAAGAVVLAISTGTVLGAAAGYARGLTDSLLMVANDALLAFPGIVLALAVIIVVGPNPYGLIVALALAYLPSVVRVVRSTMMSIREREYVEASRVIGNTEFYTLFRHVLPNSIAPIVVLATSMFGWVLLAESALSFIGLGVSPPAPTWGNMLSASRPYMETAWWLGVAPGVCIALALLGVNLLGDWLRDLLDPRMGRR